MSISSLHSFEALPPQEYIQKTSTNTKTASVSSSPSPKKPPFKRQKIQTYGEILEDLKKQLQSSYPEIQRLALNQSKNRISILLTTDTKIENTSDFAMIREIAQRILKTSNLSKYSVKFYFTPTTEETYQKVVVYNDIITSASTENTKIQFHEEGKNLKRINILLPDNTIIPGIQKNVEKGEKEASLALAKEGFYPTIYTTHSFINSKGKEKTKLIEEEALPGNVLLEELKKHPSQETVKDILSSLYSLLQALAYCENNGICHGDLKWENIVYKKTFSDDIKVYLIDPAFKNKENVPYTKQLQSSNISLPATWAYMPPERNIQNSYSIKVESWSFAMMCMRVIFKNNPHSLTNGDPLKNPFPMLFNFEKDKKGTKRPKTKQDLNPKEIEKVVESVKKEMEELKDSLQKELFTFCLQLFQYGAIPDVQKRPSPMQILEHFKETIKKYPSLNSLINI